MEAAFAARRGHAPDLPGAFAEAFASHAAQHPALARAGAAIATAMDHLAHDSAGPGDLPYHNRHHAAEATLAMGWLCRVGQDHGLISGADAALGIVAMVGHDMHHDGTVGGDGRLERRARDAVLAIAGAAGVATLVLDRLGDVILGTALASVPRNGARLQGLLPPGPHGPGHDALRALANEADVCASLLPRLGPSLGHLLAAERGLPDPGPASGPDSGPDSGPGSGIADSRLTFLRSVPKLSGPAEAIGLGEARAQSLAAPTRRGGPDERGTGS